MAKGLENGVFAKFQSLNIAELAKLMLPYNHVAIFYKISLVLSSHQHRGIR
jgi:hypothetical protein